MNSFKTEEALRKLLPMYASVRIGKITCHPSGYASAIIQVSLPSTVVRLARCAENTNVGVYVWSHIPVFMEGTGYDDNVPWYELRGEADLPGTDWPSTAEEFCRWMLHDLVANGTIEQAYADQLLAGWSPTIH